MERLAQLNITCTPGAALIVRRTTSAICAVLGMPVPELENVVLAVSELASIYLPNSGQLKVTYFGEAGQSLIIHITGSQPISPASLLPYLIASNLLECTLTSGRGFRLRQSLPLLSRAAVPGVENPAR